jgi:endo-1,4-beta-xylanase
VQIAAYIYGGFIVIRQSLHTVFLGLLIFLAACNTSVVQPDTLSTAASCLNIDNGIYVIKSRSSGKALEVQNSSLSDNARIQQWDYVKILTQQWRVERLSDGYYKIVNNNSGKSLHVENASLDKLARLTQWSYTGANNQRWCFADVGGGYVAIAAKHSNRDVAVLGNANGAPAQQYDTISPNGNFNWKLEKITGTVTPPPTTPGTLRAAADRKGLKIGVAINGWALTNIPQYRTIVAKEFNMLTPENDMKWFMIHNEGRNKYNFGPADRTVEFARQNNQEVRGHTLVWDEDERLKNSKGELTTTLPRWLFQSGYTPAQLNDILREHIFAVMGHYKGKVNYWDVVNEALLPDANQAGVDTSGFWYRNLGANYIEKSFRWAREADPTAKLFYNDFNTDGLSAKSNAQYNLLKSLKAKGVPIDGVGLQMHLDHNFPPSKADVLANFNRLSDLGLEVQITEIDVLIGTANPDVALLAKQAAIYRTVLEACLEAKRCTSFVTWGLSDSINYTAGFSSYGYDAAFLWDVNYKPKPAYEAVRQTLLK